MAASLRLKKSSLRCLFPAFRAVHVATKRVPDDGCHLRSGRHDERTYGVKAEAAAATDAAPSLVISNLNYAYPMGEKIIKDFSLTLPPGSRCLLSGANGAGKTTLLQVLAGKTMVPTEDVRVIGRPPSTTPN